MVAIAIDFKKAYDSIKRETMVEILKELKIDSKLIVIIVRIYRDDSTKIQLEEKREIYRSNERDKTRMHGINCAVKTDHMRNYRRNEKNKRNKKY